MYFVDTHFDGIACVCMVKSMSIVKRGAKYISKDKSSPGNFIRKYFSDKIIFLFYNIKY